MTEHTDPTDPGAARDAERGRALVAAATAEVRAPLRLREEVAAARGREGSRWRRRTGLLGSITATVAAAAVAVFLAVGGGDRTSAPDVLAVAGLSLRPAETAAPATQPGRPGRLAVTVDGVSFPYWDAIDWRATGTRHDRISGRDAATVYYVNARGARLGYTIVGGEALDQPPGRDVVRNATTIRIVRGTQRTVVTWRRGGHTCVISAPRSVPTDRVVALAASTGGDPDSA